MKSEAEVRGYLQEVGTRFQRVAETETLTEEEQAEVKMLFAMISVCKWVLDEEQDMFQHLEDVVARLQEGEP